jgi:2-haloacid dehalogenase
VREKLTKHYPWLCFDADGTLFDFNYAEKIALRNAFLSLSLAYDDQYLDAYRRINHQLWQALEKRKITSELLKVRRFELLLEALQLAASANHMSAAYIEHLGNCAEMIDGAYDVIDTLQKNCRLAIVTNGLKDVQRSRLARSLIRDHIAELIISEEVGAAKPKAAYFDAAFARLGNPAKSDVLIIGDSLSADMQGGVDYGIDTCWYNPTSAPCPTDLPITYEIIHLRELLELIN